ncbi:MAG: SapC family protein [Rheinheimera sp.]|nr:SapC family protein [Rheinheimera sp.]
MAHLVAVEPARHQHLYVVPQQIDTHAAGQNLIPVVPAELTHVATQLPLVLAKNGQTGQFVLAALTGFAPDENLMVQQGQWQGMYLPLQIQRQPFFVGKATPDADDYVVCIDMDSPAAGQNQPLPAGAELLFLADGGETDFYRQAKQRLVQLLQGEQQRDALIDVLLQCQLLQPMSLDITFADQSTTRLNGLYTIDADKLAALAPEQVVHLHQQGLLAAIYAIVGSAAQIYGLIARKNQQLAG